jgi:hypothetical protein
MFYLLKQILLLILVNLKLKYNKLIFNEIMALNALYVSLMHSRFVENHPIWILDDGLLISEVILSHSPSFLTITHMTLSAKQFRSYRNLMIDVAAVFCFWIEQRQNGSSISSLGLTKSQEVLNTVSVDNSLSFLMVH